MIGLRTWPLRNRGGTDLGIAEAESAEEAVRAALTAAAESRESGAGAAGEMV